MSYQMKDGTGFGVLLMVLVAVAVVGAFLVGLSMGQQLATHAIGAEAMEVLR